MDPYSITSFIPQCKAFSDRQLMVRKKRYWLSWMLTGAWMRSGCWSWGWAASWSRRWRPPWRNSTLLLSISPMWFQSNLCPHYPHLRLGCYQRLLSVTRKTMWKSSNLHRQCLPHLKLHQHHWPRSWHPQHGYHLHQCLRHGHQHHHQYPLQHLRQHHQEKREVWSSASRQVLAHWASSYTVNSLVLSLERIVEPMLSRFVRFVGSRLPPRIHIGISRSVLPCFSKMLNRHQSPLQDHLVRVHFMGRIKSDLPAKKPWASVSKRST